MFKSKRMYRRLSVFVLSAALFVMPVISNSANYYVDTGGSDSNNGLTPGTAWKTITHAAANVPAGTSGAPNDIVVAAGTYDNTTNGETFPIFFTNDYVSLTGAGSTTTILDAENINYALDVSALGFSISGFTFRNTPDAMEISEGGFTVANNIFDTTVGQGIYFYMHDSNLSADSTIPDMSISGNTFRTTIDGIFVNVYQDFDDTTENLTATFGNFTVLNNTFPVTSGDGIDVSTLYEISGLINGTVTAGDFTVTGNTFTGGSEGIDFWSGAAHLEDTSVTIGNMVISNNTFTDQSSRGIALDYWDIWDLYGTSTAVLGDLTVSGNTITATDYVTYFNTGVSTLTI